MIKRLANYLRIFCTYYKSTPGLIVLSALGSAVLIWYASEIWLPGVPQLAWIAGGFIGLFLIAYANARTKLETANAQARSLAQANAQIAALRTQVTAIEMELESLQKSAQDNQSLTEFEQRLHDLEYWTIQLRRDRLVDQDR